MQWREKYFCVFGCAFPFDEHSDIFFSVIHTLARRWTEFFWAVFGITFWGLCCVMDLVVLSFRMRLCCYLFNSGVGWLPGMGFWYWVCLLIVTMNCGDWTDDGSQFEYRVHSTVHCLCHLPFDCDDFVVPVTLIPWVWIGQELFVWGKCARVIGWRSVCIDLAPLTATALHVVEAQINNNLGLVLLSNDFRKDKWDYLIQSRTTTLILGTDKYLYILRRWLIQLLHPFHLASCLHK